MALYTMFCWCWSYGNNSRMKRVSCSNTRKKILNTKLHNYYYQFLVYILRLQSNLVIRINHGTYWYFSRFCCMQQFAAKPRYKHNCRYTSVLYTIILLSAWKYAYNEVFLQNASHGSVPRSIKCTLFILIVRLDCSGK